MSWKEITTDVFEHVQELSMPGRFVLPLRSLAIRQPNGKLWLHSPARYSEGDIDALRELGDVETIVAPNTFHHMYLKSAMDHFPHAKTLVAKGVGKKQKGLSFDGELDHETRFDGIESVFVEGAPMINESIFYHAPSKSMICTDFVLNVSTFANFQTKAFLWADDAIGFAAYSRMWKLVAKDKTKLARSAERVVAWDFDRIIMAHGDVVDSGAREAFEQSTAKLRRRA